MSTTTAEKTAPSNFIRNIIDEDLASGKHKTIVTRFPPEPNGYLHIGHAKSICLNFGLARDYGGVCHLRFDDTNPTKEEQEYVDAIKDDIHWLGFDWGDKLFFASDYFERFYDYAVQLIKLGKAYVDDLNAEEVKAYRGTLKEPGKDSPYRDRSIEENLDLFERMRAGEFPDGAKTLRAKIDMASPNINMRDPAIYRIRRAHHHRTGDKWCIYPMYTYAHPLEDMIEGITHSICTLEFEDQRPFYDWLLDTLATPCHPQQIEFARGNLNYTVTSKRKLLELVEGKHVAGWDDPRMPTLAGLRRRGYTPEAIRNFWDTMGVSKALSTVDMSVLEGFVRDDLNTKTKRVMGVVKPLKLVITNYPEGQTDEFDAPFFPDEPEKMGYRKVPFTKELYIDQSDFMENPPKKYFRLFPGNEVRLRWAYLVTCTDVVKDAEGNVIEVHCTYDPASKGGNAPDGRRVQGTIHWVSAEHAVDAEVRLYDRLFVKENPASRKDADEWLKNLNPESLDVVQAKLEPCLAEAGMGERFQFERTGYFCVDKDSQPGKPVFNRIVGLRDSWGKMVAQGKA